MEKCLICGTEFEAKEFKKFCSNSCKQKNYRLSKKNKEATKEPEKKPESLEKTKVMEIGIFLKTEREKKGLKLIDVERMSIRKGTNLTGIIIKRIESGENYRVSSLVNYCEILEIVPELVYINKLSSENIK